MALFGVSAPLLSVEIVKNSWFFLPFSMLAQVQEPERQPRGQERRKQDRTQSKKPVGALRGVNWRCCARRTSCSITSLMKSYFMYVICIARAFEDRRSWIKEINKVLTCTTTVTVSAFGRLSSAQLWALLSPGVCAHNFSRGARRLQVGGPATLFCHLQRLHERRANV